MISGTNSGFMGYLMQRASTILINTAPFQTRHTIGVMLNPYNGFLITYKHQNIILITLS
jgi:hypothetical protein